MKFRMVIQMVCQPVNPYYAVAPPSNIEKKFKKFHFYSTNIAVTDRQVLTICDTDRLYINGSVVHIILNDILVFYFSYIIYATPKHILP